MDDPTVAQPAVTPEDFPRWPHADLPARDLLNELTESGYIREWDAMERHLHEAEAEHHGWDPEGPVEDAQGMLRWPCTTVAGWALRDAFECFVNHLHLLYGRTGETAGWTYWAARDMRDYLNGFLERHDVWRRRAHETGYPDGGHEAAEA
jgi:hypothetical protein